MRGRSPDNNTKEKEMEVIICKKAAEASRLAADMIVARVKKDPKCVLGLAT